MNRSLHSILAIASFVPAFSWAACDVKSGPKTTALVELYTSEGCSSCPPADERLSHFPSQAYGFDRVVPISLHVDYWDYIGWKDRFAQPQFSERHGELVHFNGHKTVFTPHFFVSGTEVRDWREDLDGEVGRLTGHPARASIGFHAEAASPGTLSIAASATAQASPDRLGLFVALTEDRLVSKVSAGENRGAALTHEHVVRDWIGPFMLSGGHIDFRQTVNARPDWNIGQLGIAAFVQDLQTGQVLQAVGASRCLRP